MWVCCGRAYMCACACVFCDSVVVVVSPKTKNNGARFMYKSIISAFR